MATGTGAQSVTWPERALGVSAQRACGALLVAVGTVAVLAPRNSWFVFDPVVVGVTAVLTVLAGVLVARRSGQDAWLAWSGGEHAGLVGGILAMVAAWAYGVSASIRFGWDAGTITGAARLLAGGGDLDAAQVDYFARFPNNVPLLALETLIIRAGGLVGVLERDVLLAWQVLLVGIIVWCLGRTARLLGHPVRGVAVQVAALVLIGLSPQVAVPYTDLPAAACVALTLLAAAAAIRADRRRDRLLLVGLGVVVLALGCSIKPYVGVVGIAAVLMVVATATAGRVLGARLAGVAVAVVLTLGTIGAVSAASAAITGLTAERLTQVRDPFPVELWLASGTYDSQQDSPVRRYGGYNQTLVDEAAAITAQEQRRAVLREHVRENLLEPPLGQNVGFFTAKVAWVWGDGTFWASGEGWDSQQPTLHQYGALGGLSEWTTATGEHYQSKASLVQGLWVGGLLLLGGMLLLGRYDRWRACTGLALLGLTAYLLMFEARPRYLLALVPVVLAATLTSHADERPRPGDA